MSCKAGPSTAEAPRTSLTRRLKLDAGDFDMRARMKLCNSYRQRQFEAVVRKVLGSQALVGTGLVGAQRHAVGFNGAGFGLARMHHQPETSAGV